MELTQYMGKIRELAKKYRYPLIVVMIGLVLMWLPEMFSSKDFPQTVPSVSEQDNIDISSELAQILSQIEGVGKVKVMLTVSAGTSTIYQTDDDIGDTTVRKDTVIITDSDRNDGALIVQVLPEEYRGAIIVCQGGDKASVKLAVMEAVAKVTGLDPACISVLKMK